MEEEHPFGEGFAGPEVKGVWVDQEVDVLLLKHSGLVYFLDFSGSLNGCPTQMLYAVVVKIEGLCNFCI